ncbi:MAG: molybdate ABC transporter substrate-binding protein [Lachnospiraceae bacterium]|nr:molybdate ABC transporter substrate-binding protein [Lachnospiraceae bacterium]
MKKFLRVIFSTTIILSLVSCTNSKSLETMQKKDTEIIVFAAASMTETMSTIKDLYEKENPNVKIICNFDSSGTLLRQILAGADCDIFISAASKQMNQLDIRCDEKDNKDRNDFLMEGTRINLLENKVALAVPDGNPKDINSFSDLITDKVSLLAVGNADVPVGAYTIEILEFLGKTISEFEKEGKITYGSNVKEVTTQVKEGLVDAGIIYATDAVSANLQVVDLATSDMCKQVIYPVALLKATKNEMEAKKFLDYLTGDDAMEVFTSVGFSKAN